ncbi:HemK2/MTQ2 family protein methyltransferase [Thermoproteota archaeon]
MNLSINKFKMEKDPNVYDPAEDTTLLVKNLDVRINDRVLEIGVGSGYISLVASQKAESVFGIDINPHAVRLAKINAKQNNIDNVEFIVSDLFTAIKGKFSLIIMNPPYLPQSVDDKNDPIDYSWNGGRDGRNLTERFIKEVDNYLGNKGRIQIIQSTLSGYDKTINALREKGFEVEIQDEQSFFFEKIYLIMARLREKS